MSVERSESDGKTVRPESVYDAIRDRIASGTMAPGSIVTELGIAADFGVSRTPAREALRRLAGEGLVERAGRRMQVRVLREEEVLEIYEVRIALETAAAQAAAKRRTEFDIAKLRSEITRILELEEDKLGDRSRLAFAFHFAVWQAAHNATLVEALERLQLKVVGLASTTLTHPGRWDEVKKETAELVDAIVAQDVGLAATIATAHMARSLEIRMEIYSKGLRSPNEEIVTNGRLTDGARRTRA
jgi:DNA-binding GntR family transcriptional regulator